MKRLAILLALVLVVPLALASQPLRYTQEFFGPDALPCDGFMVYNDAWVIFENVVYFDGEGNWIRTQIHSTITDDFYRADDPEGTHLTGTARANHRIAPGTDGHIYWAQAGLALNTTIIIPGYGPLFRDVGRIVFDLDSDWEIVFEAGSRHDIQHLNDLLCAYFE